MAALLHQALEESSATPKSDPLPVGGGSQGASFRKLLTFESKSCMNTCGLWSQGMRPEP